MHKILIVDDDIQKHSVKIMRDMLMELDKNLPRMGLHEDQEQYILTVLIRGLKNLIKPLRLISRSTLNFSWTLNCFDNR
jgi:hypothetical protein